ncbi:uncharacterized protein B0I36DRAFT_354241 [Microdochium trichocladiopsis]|uniref:Uncharacterized protein n=1 Tax=Microdochium trichocladiopsis TaxID=1682393 RepID=A0A9P8XW22_9PEZI|nr:uncharacterized protein B0I36DRAFT_354241 [Microdochium trichocladiopsis]KAH7021616.1 hypothetical protein B0I36DRAFT_354241 [Microdochium trichocladiopsis]
MCAGLGLLRGRHINRVVPVTGLALYDALGADAGAVRGNPEPVAGEEDGGAALYEAGGAVTTLRRGVVVLEDGGGELTATRIAEDTQDRLVGAFDPEVMPEVGVEEEAGVAPLLRVGADQVEQVAVTGSEVGGYVAVDGEADEAEAVPDLDIDGEAVAPLTLARPAQLSGRVALGSLLAEGLRLIQPSGQPHTVSSKAAVSSASRGGAEEPAGGGVVGEQERRGYAGAAGWEVRDSPAQTEQPHLLVTGTRLGRSTVRSKLANLVAASFAIPANTTALTRAHLSVRARPESIHLPRGSTQPRLRHIACHRCCRQHPPVTRASEAFSGLQLPHSRPHGGLTVPPPNHNITARIIARQPQQGLRSTRQAPPPSPCPPSLRQARRPLAHISGYRPPLPSPARIPPSITTATTTAEHHPLRPRLRRDSSNNHKDGNSSTALSCSRQACNPTSTATTLSAAKMSSSGPTLRFRPEIAELLGQQTFKVNANNRGFIRLWCGEGPIQELLIELLDKDYLDEHRLIPAELRARAGDPVPSDEPGQAFINVNAFILADLRGLDDLRHCLSAILPGPRNPVGGPTRPRLEVLWMACEAKANAAPCRFCITSPASDKVKFFETCLAWRGVGGEKCMNCAWKMSRGPACNAQEDAITISAGN